MFQDRRVIGICTAELDSQFQTKLLVRVIKELNSLGYYVMVFASDSDMYNLTEGDLADASVFNLMNLDRVDVVLIFSETIKHQSILGHIVDRSVKAQKPVVSIGAELNQCYNVIYDTDTAFEQMVRHIVEYHELREVNFISGLKGNPVAERRLEIYQRVLEDNDIMFEPGRVGYGDFWFGPTRQVMDEFIDPSKMIPEAIICANDSMAVTVCDYLREHDIKVPEDIIVGGIDGIDEGIKHSPSITTCVRNEVRDAKTIADLVRQLCAGKGISRTTVLDYRMQLSQSCGCQEKHLFDSDALIAKLNFQLETHHADIRRYTEMAEEYLQCTNDEEFWQVVEKYMPDNSFLCVNADLLQEGKADAHRQQDGFTDHMLSMVKLEGKARRSDCALENVVPEAGKDMPYDKPVILLPVHFFDKIVGYMGVWDEIDDKIQTIHLIHYLLKLDVSAGLLLVKGIPSLSKE